MHNRDGSINTDNCCYELFNVLTRNYDFSQPRTLSTILSNLFSLLFLCLCLSTSSLLAQDSAKTNLIADVTLEKKDELFKKTSNFTILSIKNIAKTHVVPRSKNALNNRSVIRRNHRTLIDNHKRVASYY